MIIEYTTENDKPILHTWRRKGTVKKYIKITDFEPYFYILESEKVPKNSRIVRVESGFKSIFGEELKKITVKLPGDVGELREKFKKSFESDIMFCNRFLIDKVKEIEKMNYRIWFLDIETFVEGTSNIDSEATNPILSICVWDSYLNRYFQFVWREDFVREKKSTNDTTTYYYPSEKEMMEDFIKFFIHTDPDIISGWNVNKFDICYIIKRIKNIGLTGVYSLSPIGNVYIKYDEAKIGGRIIFDLNEGYRSLHTNELRSYRLDDVAKDELGIGKTEVEIWRKIVEIWRTNVERLLGYNRRDSELCKMIDEKNKIIDYFDDRRVLVGSIFDNCFSNSELVDILLLRFCHQKGIVLPRKPSKDEVEKFKKHKIIGADVFKPKKGIHKNVACFDFASMYPSIVVSMNISPETIDENGEIVLSDEFKFKKEKGILPQLFDKLFKERKKWKDLMDKSKIDSDEYNVYYNKQFHLKCLTNSVYGYTGYVNSRLFDTRLSNAITFVGRTFLNWMKDFFESKGINVIYGDTDSCFISSETFTPEDYKKLEEEVNIAVSEFAKKRFNLTEHTVRIEFDRIYKILIIAAKKKYAGRIGWNKGVETDSVNIVGLEAKRSDSSEFSANLQKKFLHMILNEKAKQEILDFVRGEVKKIYDGTYGLDYIGLPKAVKKKFSSYKVTNPWVRGCIYSNKYLGLNFQAGSKPKLVYVTGTGKYPKTDLVCFEFQEQVPKDFVIDKQKMVMEDVTMKLERLFEILSWGVNEIDGQSNLWSW